MPVIDNERLIKEYFEEVKEKYPDLDFKRFREICKFPFEYIKQCIRGNKFPKILVKYIGKFRTYPSKIKLQLIKEEIFFEKKITTEEEYINRRTLLTNHLKDLYEDRDNKKVKDDN